MYHVPLEAGEMFNQNLLSSAATPAKCEILSKCNILKRLLPNLIQPDRLSEDEWSDGPFFHWHRIGLWVQDTTQALAAPPEHSHDQKQLPPSQTVSN